uniref:Uncharacterized protein n=1 Tax=Candidatus Kentrum sp. LFY TaxID=2126342 RepID=A0A450WHB7_9GAMM|nr:MAG: hypothetical protein BECKLFY1418C_GA0070996_10245 [Candidatus Kentron sp. LFY]
MANRDRTKVSIVYQPGLAVMIKQTIGELLEEEEKVVLDIEGIDWYLNPYQPMLRTGGGVATFFRGGT